MLSFYKFPGDDIPIVRGSALAALNGTNDELGKNAILKLMQAVDDYIPEPKRNLEKPFLMPIEDVFSIQVMPKFPIDSLLVVLVSKFCGSGQTRILTTSPGILNTLLVSGE